MGQSVRVMCIVTSGDLPLELYWLKDGNPLTRSVFQKIDEYTLMLSIRKATMMDSGNYTCFAKNKAGESIKSSSLRVKGLSHAHALLIYS